MTSTMVDLPAPVAAHEADGGVHGDDQIDVLERWPVSLGIGKAQSLQLDRLPQCHGRLVVAQVGLFDRLEQVGVQGIERGLARAQRHHRPVQVLDHRQQAHAGKGIERDHGHGGVQIAVVAQEQHEDDQQHSADGEDLEEIAGNLTQDEQGRAPLRMLQRGLGEAAQITALQPPDLDLLDPAQHLLRDLEALAVGLEPFPADAQQELPDEGVDEAVGDADGRRCDQRDDRFDHQHESDDAGGHDALRDQLQRRHQAVDDHLVDFGENRLADIGAVPVQKPFILAAKI